MTETTGKRRPYAARVPIAERREQLLDAALAIIVRDGYDGVSIDAIAREAGVTRPVVYGAFDGLGALLTSLLDRQEVRAFGRLLQALPDEPDLADPSGFVSEAIDQLVRMIREDPDMWRPILLPPSGAPAIMLERIEHDKEQIRELFARLISGVASEKGGPAFDAELYSHALLAIAEHFGRLLLDQPDRFDAGRMAEAAEALLSQLWR